MDGRRDDHVLRVDEYGNSEVVHLDTCPIEQHTCPVFGTGYDEHVCEVGHHVSYWGLDFLVDAHGQDVKPAELPAGDYPIVLEWYEPRSSFDDGEIHFWIEAPASVQAAA